MTMTKGLYPSTLLVLFIPSHDRDEHPIDHNLWVDEALTWLGKSLGGATAFPQGRGVWRDDSRGGRLLFDNPTIVQCYTIQDDLEKHVVGLEQFLRRMGRETNQAAVACVVSNEYWEIQNP